MAGIIEDGRVSVAFVAPLSIISNSPAFVTDSLNLRQQASSHGAQRWEIITNLEPSNNSADFLVHSAVFGYEEILSIQMPQVVRRGRETTSTLLTTSDSAYPGLTSVNVTNNGRISKGEFITFGSHPKVYMVTHELNGSGPLQFFPRLRDDLYGGEPVNFGVNTIMQARYSMETVLGITYVDGILSDPGSVKFIEAL